MTRVAVGFVLGLVVSILALYLLKGQIFKAIYGSYGISNVNKKVELKRNLEIVENDKVVGEIYAGTCIELVSHDEINRFEIYLGHSDKEENFNTLFTESERGEENPCFYMLK
jgi:hypothetical protein